MDQILNVYLDMNIFKRSFDDQSLLRVRLETAAIEIILDEAAQGKLNFPWSFVLEYENSLNPNLERRAAATLLSKQKDIYIKSRDALHLACAEFAHCSYLLTCDDKFMKKAWQLGLGLKILSPVEFVNLQEKQNGY